MKPLPNVFNKVPLRRYETVPNLRIERHCLLAIDASIPILRPSSRVVGEQGVQDFVRGYNPRAHGDVNLLHCPRRDETPIESRAAGGAAFPPGQAPSP
jgi:hypothetical protein